jgi:serine/threonine-protein kinase
MITRQGFAKVMDFGIAREIKDTMSRLTRLDTSGTAAYMAPEQELGKFDGRADIYALGVTLYEALSGTPPFPGPNFLRQKELMEFKPLAEAAPTAPKEFRDAIERCLRFDANERFQTIAEFADQAKVN